MIIEKAYAKINIALEVMEKIEGYHKVNNIMIPISIYDELIFTKDDNIFIENDTIKDNICIKAAKLFLNKYNIKSGVCIKLKKNIPMMAGLAGGSSDAAATLKGLNRLYNVGATTDDLEELAKELGSDVPFFINTKAALCTNRGEIINPLNIEIPNINIVLVKPNTGLSTKEVYQNYKYLGISKKDKIDNLIKALKNNDIELLKNNIFNDLANPALDLSSELANIYNLLKSNNYNVFVSGSGPTMYLVNLMDKELEYIKNLLPKDTFICKCNIF